MSRMELVHAIESKLYERTGKALNNFDVTLPQPQNALATEIIKDPYKLDFFSLPSKFSEMGLENKLATNITRFLLELGKGFAYVGRQMELDTPSGKSYFPDMVFYHTRLKCFVVVEIKIVVMPRRDHSTTDESLSLQRRMTMLEIKQEAAEEEE